MQQICLSWVLNGLGKVMSLTPFIKCTCITGDDLKKHDCLFSNPVNNYYFILWLRVCKCIELWNKYCLNQHNPTPPKIFVPGHHARIQEFFVRGGGGWGSRLLKLFYSLKRGSNDFITHFPGGPTFSRGWGPIANHLNIFYDFPGGLDPLSPLWIRTWTLWHFGTNRLRRACAASF